MIRTISRLALAASVATAIGAAPALADSIKIGDINSYKRLPAHTIPYKNGAILAIEEINKAGGVNGKTLESITLPSNSKVRIFDMQPFQQ